MSVYTLSDLTNNNSDLLQGASKHSCRICSSRDQTSDSSAERSAAQASPFSNSNDIDALLRISRANPGQLAKWNVAPGGTITYSFVTADSAASYFAYRDETNIEEVNDRIKQNVRQILQDNYATVLPLNFVEVPDSAQSNIRIMFSDGVGAEGYAYTYYPDDLLRGGAIHLQKIHENDPARAFSSDPGSYGHSTLIHEIGHAMGLKHPGNYSFGSDQIDNPGQDPYLPLDKDNTRNTIMSYNPQLSISNTSRNKNPRSLMPYDIRALQYLYGARSDFNGDNNVYKFDSTNFNTVQTIWDGGGSDTLDFSALPANNVYSLDMNQGKPLTAKSALGDQSYYLQLSQLSPGVPDRLYTTETFGTYIAFGADIENLVGSPGNDQVLGNELANSILGSAGTDTISGGRQSDSLDGGEGGDYIYGDKGMDVLTGGGGADLLRGGRGNDTIITDVGVDGIVLELGGGTDTIVDFADGVDLLVLVDGLRFEQLSIVPSGNDTEIRIGSTGQVLALLPGMALSSIGQSDFLISSSTFFTSPNS
ncbi:M10 family metallopeptidase C-terminal domain-containing protein [Microcoleus vaginatus GB1-A2]|uniref:M10 family metallopeptidase C-terminal domain-containing protein n=1 Tax=Microcoleus vaginatus TaxID=119532 RepID=UPI001685CA5E|nr:M10 family metallopeptidase C-terminal domain-containing protein [Microcoleus sp. FACHB-61]